MAALIPANSSGGQPCVLCPYNPAHAILVHRLAPHLIRCRRQYPHLRMLTCPFNAVHVVDRFEIEAHIRNCPDNDLGLREISIDGPPVPVGTVSFDELREQPTLVDEEDWNGDHPTYNPEAATQNKDIIRPPSEIQSKAEKKQRKHKERDRIDQVKRHGVCSNPGTSVQKENALMPLRAPKEKAKALTILGDAADNLIPSFERVSLKDELPREAPAAKTERRQPPKKEELKVADVVDCEKSEFFSKVLKRIRDAQQGK